MALTAEQSAWLQALDRATARERSELAAARIIRDITAGKMREPEVQRAVKTFLLEVGIGIIHPFRLWLIELVDRFPPSVTRKFWQFNIEEEAKHWQGWLNMAGRLGVRPIDFATTRRSGALLSLSHDLTKSAKEDPAHLALTKINLVVESGAAVLTQLVAPHVLPLLGERGGWWVREHASGDERHSSITRALLAREVTSQPELGPVVITTAKETYELYRKALESAYRY